jgi:hypothetical protein
MNGARSTILILIVYTAGFVKVHQVEFFYPCRQDEGLQDGEHISRALFSGELVATKSCKPNR